MLVMMETWTFCVSDLVLANARELITGHSDHKVEQTLFPALALYIWAFT